MPESLKANVTNKKERPKGSPLTIDVQGNILDDFDSSTYHIRLYMVQETDIIAGTVFNPATQITIAESGLTSKFNIDELSFTSLQGLQSESKNLNSTKFTFTIKEPGGASMVDRIFAAAQELGIENYWKSPYFLELRFLGRENTDSAPLAPDGTGTAGEIASKVWVWPIVITSIETSVTSGGSEYYFDARNYGELGQTEQYGVIQKTLNIKAPTVDEALKELFKKLNEREPEKLKGEQSKTNEYSYGIHEKIGLLKIYNEERVLEQSNESQGQKDATKLELREIAIPANTPIVNAIELIISAAPEYHKKLKKSTTSGSNDFDGNNQDFMKQLHTISTSCKPLKYDSGNGDYKRAFHYSITPYFSGTLRSSPEEEKIANSTTRLTKYVDERLLRKAYNYIFTGLNDQVIEFDISFNYSWFVNIPPQAGSKTDMDQVRHGVKFRVENKTGENSQKESATKDNLSEASGQATEATPEPEGGQADSKASNSIATDKTNARREGSTSVNQSTGTAKRLLSDIKLTGLQQTPLTYIESPPDVDINTTLETDDREGRLYTNSLFTQAFAGYGADLAQITMVVKGDPYWVEPASYTSPSPGEKLWKNFKQVKTESDRPEKSADGTVWQNFFLFTIRTPEEADNETGVISSQTSMNVHNGVYAAISVQSNFSNGLFTQTITANREPLINISEVKVAIT